ncbi:universal stress protein [Methyloferula stellata]|uniref:universal stress protein n=1 Tax=Methyloferula stellata TaxID=876270 RepID=UPI000A003713
MRRFLVAIDGLESTDRVIATAAELAKVESGELLILTVSEDGLSQDQLRELDIIGVTEGDAIEGISRRILLHASTRARECGITNIKTEMHMGDPADMILETIKREHIDAVVIGRRGRGRLAGLILGSVSQKVACLAPCIVIIVP